MTKADEIRLLEKVIGQFGFQSYLGPWLSEYRLQLEADIRNDVTPSAPLPSVARLEGAAIVSAAKEEAATILERAHRTAHQIIDDAQEDIRQRRATFTGQLRAALDKLDW